MKTNRAYSTLEVKALDDEKRVITGIASTPSPDRMQDVVEPKGAQFKLPIPFLWQHNHDEPIGHVTEAKVTQKGIEVSVQLTQVEEPGKLKDRLDEAWQSIKSGLVRGLSIGFSAKEFEQIPGSWGLRFLSWEWFELSAVTIPANAEATITSVKSIDREQRAALGIKSVPVVRVTPAGASAIKIKTIKLPKPQEGNDMKTTAEQIAEFEATRVTKAAEMEAIMTKAAEAGETLDAEQSEQFDTLEAEIAAIDKHIGRLKQMQKAQAANAKPVAEDERVKAVSANIPGRAAAIVKSVKNEEKGIGFAKFALAMYAAKGDVHGAKAFAEHAFADDVRLQGIMKAAVSAGTTTSPTWAGNLVDYQNLSGEFIEYLRPRTIVGQFGVGRVPSLRRVPFNVRIPGKTATGTAAWVGEGYAKPVTSSGYEAQTLKWAKIAAISVITDELDRFSDPAIQTLVRDDLAEAVIERMDVDFIDPAKAVGTGATESPASVTNGVTPIPSSGNDADAVRADIAKLWANADSINLPSSSAVYITDAKSARALTLMRNPLGNREFPDVTMAGGFIDEVPVIISNYVPADSSGSLFILAFASEIYLADDGMVNIDISREASIVMDSAPNMNSGTPTAAQLVSMFQTNSMAIRAERYVRWQKRRPQAVAYLSDVNWGAA
ncbi:phage major capsid protein [Pseudomonas aeruginosa]|nr:phage major capsid protein [Pseudomonas aeruginosa]MBG7027412.1 phage major capsid protein [Pseudomonas aeruginosa]MBG7370007.1 phage major capsid protein [Pseudomonas aeruginosa]